MNNDVKNFFDSIASTWDSRENKDPLYVFSLISSIGLSEGDKVLDAGCGTGIITNMIHQLTKADVYGVDISPNMISIAKAKYIDQTWSHFIANNIYNIKLDIKFNFIIFYNSYPHFLDPTLLSKKTYDLLENNGYLVILHSLSKEELNAHHSNYEVSKVSRLIGSPNIEYKFFEKYFIIEEYLEGNHLYYLKLKKKI